MFEVKLKMNLTSQLEIREIDGNDIGTFGRY